MEYLSYFVWYSLKTWTQIFFSPLLLSLRDLNLSPYEIVVTDPRGSHKYDAFIGIT